MAALRALERYARRNAEAAGEEERCELCGAAIGERHAHVLELPRRALRCACGACAVLFRDAGAGGGRFRTVPDRVAHDPGFAPTEAEWSSLGLLVRLAWAVHDGDGNWNAFYPSPAGPVEAEVDAAAWRALAARSPLVGGIEADVEALLVRRPNVAALTDRSAARAECHVVPIDACFELCGLVRTRWQGLAGGDEAWRAVEAFFASLAARSRAIGPGGRLI